MITLLRLVSCAICSCAIAGEAAALQVPAPHTVGAVAPLVPSAVDEADALFFGMDPHAAMYRLEARLEVAPEDYESRWRAARVALVLGVMTNEDVKAAWLRTAVMHAGLALEQHPEDAEAMAWVAATKGRLALEVAGMREQAALGREVWETTNRLLAIDPEHPLGNDVRGKLHSEVSRMSGFERFLARMLLGGGSLMREASWEGSEEHLERAIRADSTVVLFYLDLGDTYMSQGKDEAARRVFETGLGLPDVYPADPHFKRTIRGKLAVLEAR